MERGFEQIFVLVAIVLAALFDLLVRWLKKKAGKDRPADVTDVDEELVLVEDANKEFPEQWPEEPQVPSPPAPAPAPAPPEPVPVLSPRPSPPTAVRPRRRHRARRWLKHPSDARRGIVLMAVLGPCRGLEAPDRNV